MARLSSKKLPIQKLQDALTYALQIGEALHEAHGKRIVHRDIKCGKILVNSKESDQVDGFRACQIERLF